MNTSDQTVLVTGADGFIGSHLVEMLHAQGYQVRALAQYNSFNNWGWLEDVGCKAEIEIITGDIRDPFFCNEICEGVNIIFHLAALIAIPYSYVAPQSYVETNVSGTVNMCKAAMHHNVHRFIHTSTSEVYGTAQYVPIDESHPLQAQSPYSASKISADSMAMSFLNSYETKQLIVSYDLYEYPIEPPYLIKHSYLSLPTLNEVIYVHINLEQIH